MIKLFAIFSLLLLTQLSADHMPNAQQNNNFEPFKVNSGDIGVPTIPPLTYQNATYQVELRTPDSNIVNTTINTARVGNVVTLTINSTRFIPTSPNYTRLSAFLPASIRSPTGTVQLSYSPIYHGDLFYYYNSGLVTFSNQNELVIHFVAPPWTSGWPQGESGGWDELTLTYTVAG